MQRLSDLMSHAGLHGYAEVALVLFLLAFLGIVLRVLAPSRRRELEDQVWMPLDDGERKTHPEARP